MPFQQGRNRVKITQVELTKLKAKDGDDNRYGIVITGQSQDGSTMDGWMFINGNTGKDGKTAYQRTLETLNEIGLPDGNLMELAALVNKECLFVCEHEVDETDYGSSTTGPLKVRFINAVREACSKNEIAAMMAHFTGGSMPQPVYSQEPQTQMTPPQFQPPVQNRAS